MQHSSLWALPPDAVEGIFSDLGREMSAHFAMPQPVARINADSSNSSGPPSYAVRHGVACIAISGVIDRVARTSWYSGEAYTAGQDSIRTATATALADPAVRSLLFIINSPGGVVAGTKELADFIAEAATRKPCAAYADGLCASAAYWLAAATGRIFAPLTATVGSIGVIAVFTDWSKASEKYGVVHHIIAGGKWKAAGHPDKSFSDEDRQYFQAQISQLHSIFRSDVATAMHITADTAHWAEGQTMLAEDARQLGLVTAIVRDVDAAVAQMASTTGKPTAMLGGTLAQGKNLKEKSMDMNEFKVQHPELYAAVLELGKTEGQAQTNAAGAAGADNADSAASATQNTALATAHESTMALVKAVAGEEIATRVSALAATGITAEQLTALAPMFAATNVQSQPAPNATAADKETLARQQALAAITNATGGPLPDGASVNKTPKGALVADAERRAAAVQQRM